LLALYSLSAFSQSPTTGRIAGTVRDQNGAVIVGVEVTVTSLATAEVRKATTDAEGNYTVSFLPPGAYRFRVAANGFNPVFVGEVRVVITETTKLNAELPVAGMTVTAITVRDAPLIQRDSPQLGRVVDSRAVTELPNANRNFLQILALSPGTFADLPDNTAVGRNSQAISVNGARRTQNNFEINGIDANSLSQNNATSVAVPAPETIQEFKVQTSLYDASFGRGAGGSVQAVTQRHETTHGVLRILRDDAFNANNPFLKAAASSGLCSRKRFRRVARRPRQTDRVLLRPYQGTRERNGASDSASRPASTSRRV
jgi:hypothetical protein